MKSYTKEYINELLERFMEGDTTVPEEDVLSEYFHTAKNVPEEWKDYQTMFAEWSQPPVQETKRPLWRWVAVAAAAVLLALFVTVLSRHTEQPMVAQMTEEKPADSTAMRPVVIPDTIPTPKPETSKRLKRQPRVNDVARDYALMAEAEQQHVEQEIADVQAEVERIQLELLDTQLRAQGFVALKHEDGTIEYINENEKTEYYAYEPD
jgi:hypothetical protein